MSSDILIIKLGALGDLIQALGPIAAIRRHHEGKRIILLTTAPFFDFIKATGLVDEVWVDSRPSLLHVTGLINLRNRLRARMFMRVYDLQTSDRSNWYFRLLGPGLRPEWSGIAPGCSHPHTNPDRDAMHTLDRQREQLAMAGIRDVPAPSLDWVPALDDFDLRGELVLVIPGGARHRPRKRWPVEKFAALSKSLLESGLRPILIGDVGDAGQISTIVNKVEGAVNLAGQTTLLQLAGLCRRARLAIGNDTGPMHMAVVAGVPSLVLYSDESDPNLCAQRGPVVEILRCSNLNDLSIEDVWAATFSLISRGS